MRELLVNALDLLFNFIEFSIFVEVILSWIPNLKQNEIIRIVHVVNEPIMKPGRYIQNRVAPNLAVDFSPIIALLLIYIIRSFVFSII